MGVTIRNNSNGTVDYLGDASTIIFTIDPINRKVIIPDDSFLDLSADILSLILAPSSIVSSYLAAQSVTAAKLTSTLAGGFKAFDLDRARAVATNDVDVKANVGGLLAKDSDPILERTNLATDKSLRIRWAAGSVIEVMLGTIPIEPSMDLTQPIILNVLAKMAASADTPTLAYGYWLGIGGSNTGGNTGALSSTLALKSFSVAVPAASYPDFAAITLKPAAHATDALYVYSAWATWTKK